MLRWSEDKTLTHSHSAFLGKRGLLGATDGAETLLELVDATLGVHELVLTGEVLYVHCDLGRIQQVLYNLIDNAIKFSRNSSTIIIETTEKNEKVLISVKDSGIGIPKENINQIWDRFYKIDASRRKDKKGTGLELSIAKEIIQSHDEHINVISTEGVGTEFVFSLPIVDDDDE